LLGPPVGASETTTAMYKLFTAVINRLLEPFAACIGEHQVGFMPRRSYFDHVKHAQVLIDYARLKGERLYLVLLDQEKAYDRVDHGFLWKALTKFGVPQELIMAIQGCYSRAQSVVSANKLTSEPVDVGSGVRQSDPLSCLLFNAVIETLALHILADKRIPEFTDDNGRRQSTHGILRHIKHYWYVFMKIATPHANEYRRSGSLQTKIYRSHS
jgi:hypothetical protein